MLDSLLASNSLHGNLQFPTRILNNDYTIIDNIFFNIFKYEKFSVYPLVNGLCDHDAQMLSISNIIIQDPRIFFTSVGSLAIRDFKFHLNYET